jgi:hypothetical protein
MDTGNASKFPHDIDISKIELCPDINNASKFPGDIDLSKIELCPEMMRYSMGNADFGLSYENIDDIPHCVFNKEGTTWRFPLDNDRVEFQVYNRELYTNFKCSKTLAGKWGKSDRFWRLDSFKEKGLTNRFQAELAAELEHATSGLQTVALECSKCHEFYIVGNGSKCQSLGLCVRHINGQ